MPEIIVTRTTIMTDPYRRLAIAIIWQAVKEAASKDSRANAAKKWIMSEECEYLTDCLNMTNSIRNWVKNGCIKPNGRMYRFDKKGDRNYRKHTEISDSSDVEEW